MNERQKKVISSQLKSEEDVLKDLKKVYKKALDDVNTNIAQLLGRGDADLQHVIYQVDYQKALKKQITAILDDMNTKQFKTISEYLSKSYEDGFMGVVYDLHGQGIPLIMPINQEDAVRAIQHDTKLSKPLYDRLGEDAHLLNRRIQTNISRGISQNSPYAEIARNIASGMVGDYSGMKGGALGKAMQIARTEAHRITSEGRFDAQTKAKEMGADIIKQWDAALDKRTRPTHARLDGQLREVDEPFEVNGHKALYPGGFGVAAEDINCRCAVLQRAKWALDEDELNTLKERAEYFGLDKAESFEDFKSKYIKATASNAERIQNAIENMRKKSIWGELPEEKKNLILSSIENGDADFVELAERTMDNCSVTWDLESNGTSHYTFGAGHITMFSPRNDSDVDLAQTFWHEYGHYLDDGEMSKSGISYTKRIKYSSGKMFEDTYTSASYIAEELGYDGARGKDVNNLLENLKLSDSYYMKAPEDKYSNYWMYKKADNSPMDVAKDYKDMDKLGNALNKKFEDISGVTNAKNYLNSIGYPQAPKHSDYFESYTTPKRHTIKTRPKYKGAEDDWFNALRAADEAEEAFKAAHDMDAIWKEKNRLFEEAEAIKNKLGWVSDTIDGSVYGAFQSVVLLGGHTRDYYLYNNNNIKEGVANVFMANITGDEQVLNAFNEICPEIFKLITGVWKNGK